LKHEYIGTEHILLGLLREEEGVAARVLTSLGITVEKVHPLVAPTVGDGEEVTIGEFAFTRHANTVLELAVSEALLLEGDCVGTEHILLALVRENEGVGAGILLDFDAYGPKIRSAIIPMLSGPAGRALAARGPYWSETDGWTRELQASRRSERLLPTSRADVPDSFIVPLSRFCGDAPEIERAYVCAVKIEQQGTEPEQRLRFCVKLRASVEDFDDSREVIDGLRALLSRSHPEITRALGFGVMTDIAVAAWEHKALRIYNS